MNLCGCIMYIMVFVVVDGWYSELLVVVWLVVCSMILVVIVFGGMLCGF